MIVCGDMFGLREFYKTNTDSIEPGIDLVGKVMVASSFNQHEEAAKYCSDLLNNLKGNSESQYYNVTNMPLCVNGVSITIPKMPLLEDNEPSEHHGRMGLASFMLFKKVSFDLSRMILCPEE